MPDTGLDARSQVNDVTAAMREMILAGELLPGQQIRQAQMAARLGVSRLPIREGLRQLMADGLVVHVHNVGFTVARLSHDEFQQVYLMRRVLETEVLTTLRPPDVALLDRLVDLNREIEEAGRAGDVGAARVLNKDFHFTIFALSPLSLVVAEVERIWAWAMPYQAVSLHDAVSRDRILGEHRAIIDALRDGRADLLVSLMDGHREGSENQLGLLMKARRSSRTV